ncbi:MAG: hypothetical protein CMP75_03250 [Flavobacteriales bacterium]|nr:hypothetical protein [Flavobacteriales bacterium]|tara:strand:+ start:581 stop:1924 length:1344 start_codon:yes stop_codon:yes gene_type:complete
MLSHETHQKIYFWTLAYLCFSVPFMSKWLPFTIGVVILALNFLAEGNLFSRLKKVIRTTWVLLFVLFYVLHLVSAAYSTNFSEAFRDFFLKLPLLIIPVALLSVALSESQKKRLYSFWIVAIMIAACLLLGQAYINYSDTGYGKYWYYTSLAGGKHPAYFSMYCITAIILLFQGKFEKWKALPLMILLLMVFLLSSRMQILVLLVVAFVKVCQEFTQSKKVKPIVIVAFVGFLSLFLSENVRNKIRLNTAQKEIGQLFSQDFKSSTRGAIWDFGLQTIQESPWIGHGNGDEFEVLNQAIQSKVQLKELDVATLANQTIQDTSIMKRLYSTSEKRGWDKSDLHFRYAKWKLIKDSDSPYNKFYKHYYNYHNQFLQSWATCGILCLLVLLGIFFVSVKMGIQHKDFTLLAIAFLIAMSFISESMLERQYGVIYFALILPIMMLESRKSV